MEPISPVEDDARRVEAAASQSDRRAMAVEGRLGPAGRAACGEARAGPSPPGSWTAPASSSIAPVTRPAPAAPCTRRRSIPVPPRSRSSPTSAGSCRCAATRASGRTATSRRPIGEWRDGTGAAAAQTSPGGARSHRTRSSGPEPVYRTMRDELVEMMGETVYELVAALSRRPPPVGRHVRARCRPPGTGATPCGSARQGQRPARLGFGAAGVSPQVAGSPAWRARPLSERGAPLPLLRPRALRTRRGTTKHVAPAADGRTPGTVRPAPRTRASSSAPPRIAGVDLFSRVAPS